MGLEMSSTLIYGFRVEEEELYKIGSHLGLGEEELEELDPEEIVDKLCQKFSHVGYCCGGNAYSGDISFFLSASRFKRTIGNYSDSAAPQDFTSLDEDLAQVRKALSVGEENPNQLHAILYIY